jgi:hypothetical protein
MMSASASSLDAVNGRRQRMWASGDDAVYLARTGTKEFPAPVTQPKGCPVRAGRSAITMRRSRAGGPRCQPRAARLG